MARSFDGVDDEISLGTDTSIDTFTTLTAAFWIKSGSDANFVVVCKDGFGSTWALNKSGAGRLAITGTRGWTGGTNVNGGELLLTGGTMDLGNRQITVAAGAVAEYRGIEVIGGFLRGAGTHRLGTAAGGNHGVLCAGRKLRRGPQFLF